jgi:hypothetical protein
MYVALHVPRPLLLFGLKKESVSQQMLAELYRIKIYDNYFCGF